MGEVGLGGEVRQVAHAARRLGEAARVGFRARPWCPRSTPDVDGIRLDGWPPSAEALVVAGRSAATAAAGGPSADSG